MFDPQGAADAQRAMNELVQASQALYMTHLHASQAAQPVEPERLTEMRDRVLAAARSLVEVCHATAIHPSELFADLAE